MKNFTMILAFMLFATISTKATIWTVSNSGGDNQNPNFTDLQTAIDSASAGDTLYVSGSPIEYKSNNGSYNNSMYVRKQLTIIGAGYNIESSSYLISKIYRIYFTSELDTLGNIVSSGANSIIMGFKISRLEIEKGVDNVLLSRNKIDDLYIVGDYTDYCSGNIIINNLIYKITATSYCSNNTFSNNIISNSGNNSKVIDNSLISNNLFISVNSGTQFRAINFTNCTLKNNILYLSNPRNMYSCVVKNNLLYCSGSDSSFNISSTYNNIEGQDPLFTDITEDSTQFDYVNDYHLLASSPGKNAGTDGTDVGIYGGSYPFPSGGPSPYSTSPLPTIPQIIKLELSNYIVPKDSVIHINLKARISN